MACRKRNRHASARVATTGAAEEEWRSSGRRNRVDNTSRQRRFRPDRNRTGGWGPEGVAAVMEESSRERESRPPKSERER
eukprot:ctg_3128.g575